MTTSRRKCTAFGCTRKPPLGKKRCDECRKKINEGLRARVAHRKKVGLCRCGGKRTRGRKSCQWCLDYHSAYRAEVEATREVEGKCPRCGKRPPMPGCRTCKHCKDQSNAAARAGWRRARDHNPDAPRLSAWRLQNVREGLCETCGQPPGINPKTGKPYRLCKQHRLAAALRCRRHYARAQGLADPPPLSSARSVTLRRHTTRRSDVHDIGKARRMKLAKLTPAQLDWLRHAKIKGYEAGFVATPIKSLCDLEKLGLIERNPTTSGKSTHWRITDRGERAKFGKQ